MKIFEEMADMLVVLPDEDLGKLLKNMIGYRFDGVDNGPDDLGWKMIKAKIDAAREWDDKRSVIYSNNRKKGWEKIKRKQNKEEVNPHAQRT